MIKIYCSGRIDFTWLIPVYIKAKALALIAEQTLYLYLFMEIKSQSIFLQIFLLKQTSSSHIP